MRTVFEYLYRDAGNFKAFGQIILDGEFVSNSEKLIRSKLESEEFFIAEQVGVPTLYDQLYQWSGGPIEADHCWHEFVGFRNAEPAEKGTECAVTMADFVARFTSVDRWDGALSPHFNMSDGSFREYRSDYPRNQGSIHF